MQQQTGRKPARAGGRGAILDDRHDRDGDRRRHPDHHHRGRHAAKGDHHIADDIDDLNDNPLIFMRTYSSLILAVLLFLPVSAVSALDGSSATLLKQAWPDVPSRRVSEIGRGVGVVFSPDLSVPDNCRFYQSLGFACFQAADWDKILDDVHRYNVLYPERRIFTLVLETHGTNGNGLKLQTSYDPAADRSYISAGALQQRLEPEGIYYAIISACNSGRLLRPAIYNQLDPNNGDKLFLPPTKGIVNASPDFVASRSAVMIITPESSHIETTLVGNIAGGVTLVAMLNHAQVTAGGEGEDL